MSTTISGKDVWDLVISTSINRDSEISKVCQPFVELLPDILVDMLDTKVTFLSLMQAKLAYWRYCAENDLSGMLVEAAMPNLGIDMDLGPMKEKSQKTIEQLVDHIENLSRRNMDPHSLNSILNGTFIGLNNYVRALLALNQLTIAKLLELQPGVILDLKVVNVML